MDRISTICSYLERCTVFADVGCDHGYCTQYMLVNGLCESAIISDISEKSLKKAQTLLSQYIESGVLRSVCCDGLSKIENADFVLIAGMGGEEIIKILKESYIPPEFVFQPMKNAELLRTFLLENGCVLTVDDIFKDGKYYFIIKGHTGGEKQTYSEAEIKFGRESLNNPVFKEWLQEEITKFEGYLNCAMSDINRRNLNEKINYYKGIYKNESK